MFNSQYSNKLLGVFTRTTSLPKGTFYTLSTSGGEAVMKRPAISLVAANNIYLPFEEGFMPDLQTYTFDFDDLVDAVPAVESNNAQSSILNPQSTYDLQGRKINGQPKDAILIIDGKKVTTK